MKAWWTVVIVLLLACPTRAATKDTQTLIFELSPTASDAVLPVYVWFDVATPAGMDRLNGGVLGTGFLVDRQGDFVTAAHVIDLTPFTSDPKFSHIRLTALLRQRDGSGFGQDFDVMGRDDDHDLVLCRIKNFPGASTKNVPNIPDSAQHPFASLAVSAAAPKVGQFVLVSGFPLGSLTPAIQFGMVSATRTIYQNNVPGTGLPKDTGDMLQISVEANHGNSGGPVIDLTSGQVVGVIDQLIPAPLQINGQPIRDQNTFAASGLMLAGPAKWVEALLEKNHIRSEAVAAGKLVIR